MKQFLLFATVLLASVSHAQDRGASRPAPTHPLTTQQSPTNQQRGGGATNVQPSGSSNSQNSPKPAPGNAEHGIPTGAVLNNYMILKMQMVGKDEITEQERQDAQVELKRSISNMGDVDDATRAQIMEAYERAGQVKTREDYLNQLGLLGWEIVTVVPYNNEKGIPMNAVYLKRKALKGK